MNSWDEENAKMFSSWGLSKVNEMEEVHGPAIDFIIKYIASEFLNKDIHERSRSKIRLLDVGTGSGHLITKILASHPAAGHSMELIGVDVSPEMVSICESKFRTFLETVIEDPEGREKLQENVHFHQGNVLDICDSLGKFSIIICLESIYYISDMELALRKLHGILEENGILLVAVEFGMVLTDDEEVNQERISIMSKEISIDRIHLLKLKGYVKKLKETGFTSVNTTDEDGFHYITAVKSPRQENAK
ncbi:MAG: class I SAM-dependent methyltransferase [Candidatus Hodarchaeota archaeon]